MNLISDKLIDWGITRDSLIWFWSKLASGAALIASGLLPVDQYIGPKFAKVATVLAVLVLWLAGTYDKSPLPGKK